MFNQEDIAKLRSKGTSNIDILKTMGRIVPSAQRAYDGIVSNKNIPEWQKDEVVGRMLDKKVPKKGPSGLMYAGVASMNDAQKKFDEKTAQQEAESKGFLGRAWDSIKSVPERFQRGFGSEETQQGRKEVSRGFDLADLPGDIADVIGPALPVIGGMLGGAIAAPAAVTGVGVLGTAAAAGAGAAAMEGGRQMVGDLMGVDEKFSGQNTKDAPDIIKVAKEGALNAGGELGGQLLIKGLTKVAAPFAKQFMSDTAEIAARQGVKLPVSAMTESNVVRTGEAIASKGFFGGRVQKISEEAGTRMAQIGDEILQKIGGSDDLLVAGKSIEEGAQQYRAAWQSAKSQLYKEAADMIAARPKREYIDVSKPIEVLTNILGSKGQATELLGDGVQVSRLQTILNNLKGKKLSIGILESASNELNQLINHGGLVKTGDEAALSSVQQAIQGALESHVAKFAPEVAEALAKADDVYKQGITLLDGQVGNTIDTLSQAPEKIVDAIIKPNSESSVQQLMELIGSGENGAQKVANVRTAFAKKIMDASKNPDGLFAGDKLVNNLKRYNPKTIAAVFGKDTVQQLDELAKLTHAFTSGQKMATGSQTAFIGKISAAATALLAGRPDLALAIVASDYGLTKLFSTDAGRKLLTEGFQMHLGRSIPNAAQGAVQGMDQLMQPEPSPQGQ